jgi:hypothetical protein
MVAFNPEDRITMEEIAMHPWAKGQVLTATDIAIDFSNRKMKIDKEKQRAEQEKERKKAARQEARNK